MARFGAPVVLMLVSLALAGCGTTPGCRAISTGALGAAAGAGIGAIAGAPGLGAAIGGATGAIGGAATSPSQASLGPSPVCD